MRPNPIHLETARDGGTPEPPSSSGCRPAWDPLLSGTSLFRTTSSGEVVRTTQLPTDGGSPVRAASSGRPHLSGTSLSATASPDEAVVETQPPEDTSGPGVPDHDERPRTRWSPIRGWLPADDPDWIEAVDDVAALLGRLELAAVHRVRAAAARAVLSLPEFLVLSELAVRPGPLTGAQVASVVGVGSGGISGILVRLEEQELVGREPHPTDGRGFAVCATDAGRSLLREATGEMPAPSFVDQMRGLSTERLALVESFLGVVANRWYREVRHLRELPRKR